MVFFVARFFNSHVIKMTVGWTDMKLESWMNIVSCRIQIWQILDFEILECGLGLVVDEYFFSWEEHP